MLSSHMSRAELARRGYYPVGGCGGNLEWHHEGDTMEVADALYGVSMRGDGVTTVISQRLREEQPA